jgi:hypothetical protein
VRVGQQQKIIARRKNMLTHVGYEGGAWISVNVEYLGSKNDRKQLDVLNVEYLGSKNHRKQIDAPNVENLVSTQNHPQQQKIKKIWASSNEYHNDSAMTLCCRTNDIGQQRRTIPRTND